MLVWGGVLFHKDSKHIKNVTSINIQTIPLFSSHKRDMWTRMLGRMDSGLKTICYPYLFQVLQIHILYIMENDHRLVCLNHYWENSAYYIIVYSFCDLFKTWNQRSQVALHGMPSTYVNDLHSQDKVFEDFIMDMNKTSQKENCTPCPLVDDFIRIFFFPYSEYGFVEGHLTYL